METEAAAKENMMEEGRKDQMLESADEVQHDMAELTKEDASRAIVIQPALGDDFNLPFA